MKLLRFFYINTFSFILIVLGAATIFIPIDIFYLILKILIAIWCVSGGILLITRWKARKRKIEILVARNLNKLRPDTFRQLKRTLCGQLMVNLAISDLRKTENYQNLSKEEWKRKVKHMK